MAGKVNCGRGKRREPLRDIRDKVGMDLDILVDGQAHFQPSGTELIDTEVVFSGGYGDVPKGSGLGVRLHREMFKEGKPGYRMSRI